MNPAEPTNDTIRAALGLGSFAPGSSAGFVERREVDEEKNPSFEPSVPSAPDAHLETRRSGGREALEEGSGRARAGHVSGTCPLVKSGDP